MSSATATLTSAAGQSLPVCVVDEVNSTDPTAHSILSLEHSVVVFPRDPLQPSTSYTWTTTADGVPVTRTFTTAATDAGGPPPTGTTTTTTTTTTTVTTTTVTTAVAAPTPPASAAGAATVKVKPGCSLTSPAKIARSHGKAKLKTVQKCHGEKGKAKLLLQKHQGKKWVTVSSSSETLGETTKTWTGTTKAAHNAQYRWVLQLNKKTLATSRTTTAV